MLRVLKLKYNNTMYSTNSALPKLPFHFAALYGNLGSAPFASNSGVMLPGKIFARIQSDDVKQQAAFGPKRS